MNDVPTFFDRYARAVNSSDVDTIADSYLSPYFEASPSHVVSLTVDDAYREALRKRNRMLRDDLGFREAALEVQDERLFAPGHTQADVRWTLRFQPEGREEISSSFVISYLLREEGEDFAILGYVSHEDEATVMRRDGVLPENGQKSHA